MIFRAATTLFAVVLTLRCEASNLAPATAQPEAAAPPTPAVHQATAPERAAEPESSPDEIARSLLSLAQKRLENQDPESAEAAYTEVLNLPTSDAVTEDALLLYARFLRDTRRPTRAAATYEKFLSSFPSSKQASNVLIELGRTLRELGAFNTALARFYAVLNSSLAVLPSDIERYREQTQIAKFEIADTFYQQGDYASAVKFFGRVKLLDLPPEVRARAAFREAYAFFLDGKLDQAVVSLRAFLGNYPHHEFTQESRYLLCLALRRMGRTQEALSETLTLLRTAQAGAGEDQAQWTYWQRRTGNQLANDFYEQGDFNAALTIYQTLAELRSTPAWRWPALYQIGLCYERLRQPGRATGVYRDILAEFDAAKTVGSTVDATTAEVRDMAEWRLGQIDWTHEVDRSIQSFSSNGGGANPAVQSLN